MTGLAIIAGSGRLPQWIAEKCARENDPYMVVNFGGQDLPWSDGHPVLSAEFERPGPVFKTLQDQGLDRAVFVGGMQRPQLKPLRFDRKFLGLAPKLLPALRAGDDVTLRFLTDVFEGEGLRVIAPNDILKDLVIGAGSYAKTQMTKADQSDLTRAKEIVTKLGEADVGQGVVVAQGLCLGLESLQGTDAMLGFVAQTSDKLRPDPEGAKGLFFKAPKRQQDRRLDLPAIGPDTIDHVAKAGLGGLVIEAHGVMVLGMDEVIAAANKHGLFFVADAAEAT